jgi:trehalose-6-phosphate synthase
LVHDYHLIPIADALRRRGHANRIGFFLHIPFPSLEVLTSLPKHEQLIPLLLQYDVVGFQTESDAAGATTDVTVILRRLMLEDEIMDKDRVHWIGEASQRRRQLTSVNY